MSTPPDCYGLVAEFNGPSELTAAAERTYAAGYRRIDAFSPFPIEGLAEALGSRRTWVAPLVLLGGLLGGGAGYLMQYYLSAIDYPLNIGGRPLNSWPAFIPVTFEMTILGAGLFAVLGMLALNGLPMPHHPVFNVPRFALASRDRYFLCIMARDPKFDPAATRGLLSGLGPVEVADVED